MCLNLALAPHVIMLACIPEVWGCGKRPTVATADGLWKGNPLHKLAALAPGGVHMPAVC